MPLTSLKEILDPAFDERYGVAAINIVNDLTIEAVLAAAAELKAPVILQTSLKTVKQIGAKPLYEMTRPPRSSPRRASTARRSRARSSP
jgi:fructose-bisphosphate aldolase class II